MIAYIFIFCFGLIIGSFLNVCIYRLPRGESIVYPPSHCPNCGGALRPQELVPVFSFLWLKGHCHTCKAAISPRYPLTELLTGLLFICNYARFGWSLDFIFCNLFTAFLLIIFWIDFDWQLILDKVLIWVTVAAVGLIVYQFAGSENLTNWWDRPAAAMGGGLLFLFLALLTGGMGAGDVKLTFVLGLWLGVTATLETLFIAFVLGGISGAILLLLGKKGYKDAIPFGPFLCTGAWISYLYGAWLLNWYVSCFF